jgi:hypothetical protein
VLQVEVREQVLAEDVLHCRPVGDVIYWLECQVAASESGGKPSSHHTQMTPQRLRNQQHACAPALQFTLQGIQPDKPIYGLKRVL